MLFFQMLFVSPCRPVPKNHSFPPSCGKALQTDLWYPSLWGDYHSSCHQHPTWSCDLFWSVKWHIRNDMSLWIKVLGDIMWFHPLPFTFIKRTGMSQMRDMFICPGCQNEEDMGQRGSRPTTSLWYGWEISLCWKSLRF